MHRPCVLLADDHANVAESLARLLRDDFDVVEIVHDGERLLEAAQRLQPDIIVSDMSMPVMSGLEALRRLKAVLPRVRVVFLTQHTDAELASQAIRARALGYVL
jgi:DNA-binding NarL/FixJ family response regulator